MNTKRWVLAVLTICFSVVTWVPVHAAADAKPAPPHAYLPPPPYPYSARRNIEQGSGLVEFSTDASGKIARLVMLRSTGWADLDENAINFAQTHWKAFPNTTVKVPIDYRLTGQNGVSGLGKPKPGQWYTPTPHYPPASVRFMESGDGVVKITTNATGHVINAEMVKSTGAKRLDENSIHYAIGFWQGPPNSTREVPVRYAMKAPHF